MEILDLNINKWTVGSGNDEKALNEYMNNLANKTEIQVNLANAPTVETGDSNDKYYKIKIPTETTLFKLVGRGIDNVDSNGVDVENTKKVYASVELEDGTRNAGLEVIIENLYLAAKSRSTDVNGVYVYVPADNNSQYNNKITFKGTNKIINSGNGVAETLNAAIRVGTNKKLILGGDGNVKVGRIGEPVNGAGIGGNSEEDSGYIAIVDSVNIEVSSYGGAAIGGGAGNVKGGDGKGIVITDNAVVNATSSRGAAIGGGAVKPETENTVGEYGGNGENILIDSNSIVTIRSDSGAGIGGGFGGKYGGNGKEIVISGNAKVDTNSYSSYTGAGIGGGYGTDKGGDGQQITIEESANVTTVSSYGAAIGGGHGGNNGGNGIAITISDNAVVNATSTRGAGIGGGHGLGGDTGLGGNGQEIMIIDNAIVNVKSRDGAGIGGGYGIGTGGTGNNIIISDAAKLNVETVLGAGIGGGYGEYVKGGMGSNIRIIGTGKVYVFIDVSQVAIGIKCGDCVGAGWGQYPQSTGESSDILISNPNISYKKDKYPCELWTKHVYDSGVPFTNEQLQLVEVDENNNIINRIVQKTSTDANGNIMYYYLPGEDGEKLFAYTNKYDEITEEKINDEDGQRLNFNRKVPTRGINLFV